ncbi:MAG TPA: sigma-54 dependent transcriptional regulator [Longimicrobiaceae bacterium]|nr:sigma-54 dependent transcriptional regulator [Longimicrobiaceae bacterium]
MKPIVAVLQLSDSFADEWIKLAVSAGAEACVIRSGAELTGLVGICGIVVGAAGVEAEAMSALAELTSRTSIEAAVVGAETGHRLPVALIQAGASSYFALPDDLSALRSWIVERTERVLHIERARALTAVQRAQYDFSRLVGESTPFRAALERAEKVIPHGSTTVLITGETGTGKDLLAQAIHYNGPRAAGAFVEINCAALPSTLLEAELFGYERGAFTDARSAKPGLFEAADRGTLFLDEVGELSLELQAKLLKVLENRRVRRLGSVRDVEVDVRIIAATNVDLAARVRGGSFRKDLFYRLNVVPVQLPSLSWRGKDVILLANHFLDRFSREYQIPRPPLTQEVHHALLSYTWPGNVRELRNAIERALLLGNGVVRVEDLLFGTSPDEGQEGGTIPFPATLDEIVRAAARAMTERCGGNKSRAARMLGIGRRHLYTLLEAPGSREGR